MFTLYVGFLIWVILFSWGIIIWSVIEYIRRRRSEKEIMEWWIKRRDERLGEIYGWYSGKEEE